MNETTPCSIVPNTSQYTEAGVTGIRFMTVDRAHMSVCARVGVRGLDRHLPAKRQNTFNKTESELGPRGLHQHKY